MDKVSIEAVLLHYGAERVPHARRWAAIKCPFHNDTSASASVNVDLGKFTCFACNISGDGFDIIMREEGIADFPSAIEFAERNFGYSDSGLSPGAARGSRKRRSISSEAGPVQGQRNLLSTGRRRQPLAGS